MKPSVKRAANAMLTLIALVLLAPGAALAQEAGAGLDNIQHFGAAIGGGIVVLGAGIGIGRFTSSAVESIARQPQASKEIVQAYQLPLFLLEGVAVIALGVCFVVVFQT